LVRLISQQQAERHQWTDWKVEIAVSAELVDLAKDGFDAGIRLGEFIASDMVAVRLTPPFRLVILASPGYLVRVGRPRIPADLAAHACVRMRRSDGTLAHWRLQDGGSPVDLEVSGPLIVHDYPSMLDAALAGAAMAQVPEPIAQEHVTAGRLEEVLRKYAPSTLGVFLYFPDRRQLSPKLRVFIDHARTFAASRDNANDNAPRRRRSHKGWAVGASRATGRFEFENDNVVEIQRGFFRGLGRAPNPRWRLPYLLRRRLRRSFRRRAISRRLGVGHKRAHRGGEAPLIAPFFSASHGPQSSTP
jgi:hypothetical protein